MVEAIGPMAYFHQQLERGRFLIQRSKSSGKFVFYPRALEPGTGNDDLEWVQATGRGQIYACTTIYPRKRSPYNISIVELEEGPRLMTRVEDADPESLRIGMAVFARINKDTNQPQQSDPALLVFSVHPGSLVQEESR